MILKNEYPINNMYEVTIKKRLHKLFNEHSKD